MKFSLTSTLTWLLWGVGTTHVWTRIPAATAAPIALCGDQAACLEFTAHKVEDATVCDCDCYFNICMTLNLGLDSCDKTGTVSHTCEKDADECAEEAGFTTAAQVPGIGNGYTTCQKVPAGGTAEFLLKDGNANGNCETASLSFQSDYTATCGTYGVQSCTGVGNVGKECVWTVAAPANCNKIGGCFGDPHIKTWDQKRFDFHGECDLVLLHSDHVNKDNVPLDLHVRTTIQGFYSSIESAALRVGDTVFQLDTDKFFVNNKEYTDDAVLPMTLDEFTVQAVKTEGVAKIYTVLLTDASAIKFKVIKNFLSVSVSGHEDDFGESVGLLGDYYTGSTLNRNGDLMNDFTEYGMEWQVTAEEPKLFQDLRHPQLPGARCIMPAEGATSRHRYLRNKDDIELNASAERICNTKEDYESCMEDVLATGDLDLAQAW